MYVYYAEDRVVRKKDFRNVEASEMKFFRSIQGYKTQQIRIRTINFKMKHLNLPSKI